MSTCCTSLVCIKASGEDLRQLVWIVMVYKAMDLKPESMSKSLVSVYMLLWFGHRCTCVYAKFHSW